LSLKRPGSSRLIAAGYFLYDLAVLVATFLLAAYIEHSGLGGVEIYTQNWLIGLLIVVSSLVALKLAKAQFRHWSRATIRDFASLLLWFAIGLMFAFTVSTFLVRDLAWSNFRLFTLVSVFASILFLLPRGFTAGLRELIVDSQHRSLSRSKGVRDRLVIYGAGDLGELFLHHLKVTEPTQLAQHRIIGFIDDNPNLSLRSMDGFRIYGGVEQLAKLKEEYNLDGVLVCASRISEEKSHFLNRMACELGLSIYRWHPQLHLVETAKFIQEKVEDRTLIA